MCALFISVNDFYKNISQVTLILGNEMYTNGLLMRFSEIPIYDDGSIYLKDGVLYQSFTAVRNLLFGGIKITLNTAPLPSEDKK